MNNIYALHKYVNHTLRTLVMMILFVWCGNMSAAVVGSGTVADPYVLEQGTEYQFQEFGSFYAKFTAPSEGKFVLACPEVFALYTDASFSTIDENIIPLFNGNYENSEYSFDCEANKTYYVGTGFIMNGGTATFKFLTETEPIELLSCLPEAGTIMNAASASVDLTFNQAVIVNSCTMTCGANTTSVPVNVRDVYASVDVKNQLAEWYNNNKIAEGDDIKFTFSGIKAAADQKVVYGENGTFEVTYKASSKPVTLVSSTNTPTSTTQPMTNFKSYYMEEDYSSLVNLEFNGNIKEVGSVTLEYGSREPVGDKTELYIETLTPTIIANYVLIDLKGKLRRHEDMLPGVTNKYDYVSLIINGVKDEAGNLALSTDQGSIGNFTFTYNFEEVNYSVESDIDEGSPLTNDTKNIKLWIMETGGNATFSGAQFAYKENGEDKTADVEGNLISIATDEENEGARFVTIPVPNVNIDANSNVTITLNGETPDGVAHDAFKNVVNCTGKTADLTELAVTSALWHGDNGDVEMMNGNIGELTDMSTTTVTLNKTFGYCEWNIAEDGGDIMRMGFKSSDTPINTFDIEWFGEKFTQGKTYTMTLLLWNDENESHGAGYDNPTVGTTSFSFNGAAEGYIYSDVELSNVIKGSVLLTSNEQNTYVLKFSAPANVKETMINTGGGTSVNCDVVPNDDKTEWTVTLNRSVLNSFDAFDLNVFAEDMEGHAINKAHSESVEVTELEDNTWLTIHFSAEFNRWPLTVTPASESTLEQIDRINFSYSSGISFNWGGNPDDKIVIRNNANRDIIAEFTRGDLENNADDNNVWIELDEPITAAGVYEITVPSGFFVLGEQMMSSLNKQAIIYYEIKGDAEGAFTLTADPAGGKVDEIPATIVLTANDRSEVGNSYDILPTLTDNKGNSYALSTEYGIGWNQINVVLADGAITADGVYTLTVPVGSVIGNSETDVNEELVITYIIGTETAIDSIVANAGGKVDVYTVNGVNILSNADAAAVKALGSGLYIINGKKIVIRK